MAHGGPHWRVPQHRGRVRVGRELAKGYLLARGGPNYGVGVMDAVTCGALARINAVTWDELTVIVFLGAVWLWFVTR